MVGPAEEGSVVVRHPMRLCGSRRSGRSGLCGRAERSRRGREAGAVYNRPLIVSRDREAARTSSVGSAAAKALVKRQTLLAQR
jgi:hypothetical protein